MYNMVKQDNKSQWIISTCSTFVIQTSCGLRTLTSTKTYLKGLQPLNRADMNERCTWASSLQLMEFLRVSEAVKSTGDELCRNVLQNVSLADAYIVCYFKTLIQNLE